MDAWTALGPIVVGVSGAGDDGRALDWAADLAALTGRRVRAVHAVECGPVRPTAHDQADAERFVVAAGLQAVQGALKGLREDHPEMVLESDVLVGDPATVLLEEATDAWMVVVASRDDEGRAGLGSPGSVGLALARHCPCPVVVTRPSEAAPGAHLADRVVLGLDGSAASRGAAEFAFSFASLTGLPLVALHGSLDQLARGSSSLALLSAGEVSAPTDEEMLSAAESVAGLPERFPGVPFRVQHRTADPAQALVDASRSARLVVVGVRGRGRLRTLLLRSVSSVVIKHAHCPVAVVRPPSG